MTPVQPKPLSPASPPLFEREENRQDESCQKNETSVTPKVTPPIFSPMDTFFQSWQHSSPAATAVPSAFDVVSHNVDGLFNSAKKLYTLQHGTEPVRWNISDLASAWETYLDSQTASVICVQETRLGKPRQAFLDLLQQMKNWAFVISDPRSGHYGVGTFYRRDLTVQVSDTMDTNTRHTNEGRIQTLFIERYAIVNCYVPNGMRLPHRHEYKLDFLTDLRTYCDYLRNDYLVIVAADLNVIRSPDDVHKGRCDDTMSTCTPLERNWVNDLLESSFHDPFRAHHPFDGSKESRGCTWYQYRTQPFWRIDYILVDSRIPLDQFTVSHHRKPVLSDHTSLRLSWTKAPPHLVSETLVSETEGARPDSLVVDLKQDRYDEVRSKLEADPYFGPILRYREKGSQPEDTEEAALIRSRADSLILKKGLLYRVTNVNDSLLRRNPVSLALCVPSGLREEVLQVMHDDIFSGHLSLRKTLPLLLDRFWWPDIYASTTNFIKSCRTCCTTKEVPLATGLIHPVPVGHRPMERLSMDIMGPLPVTSGGYKYVLVVVDHFTKWIEAFPLKDTKEETVARILVEQIFCRFGIPAWLHSDGGPQMASNLQRRIARLLGFTKAETTPYQPRANGAAERCIKTLSQMIRAYIDEYNYNDWDTILPYILFAYRTHYHAVSGDTPFYMIYGRDPRLPADVYFGIAPDDSLNKEIDLSAADAPDPTSLLSIRSPLADIGMDPQVPLRLSTSTGKRVV